MPTQPFPDALLAAMQAVNFGWLALAASFILLDLASGFIIKGVMQNNVKSSIMREGLVHKAWEVAIMVCAVMLDIAISMGMGLGIQPVSTATCVFIVIMEAASVCENAMEGNPELASAPLIKYVAQAKQEQQDQREQAEGGGE